MSVATHKATFDPFEVFRSMIETYADAPFEKWIGPLRMCHLWHSAMMYRYALAFPMSANADQSRITQYIETINLPLSLCEACDAIINAALTTPRPAEPERRDDQCDTRPVRAKRPRPDRVAAAGSA